MILMTNIIYGWALSKFYRIFWQINILAKSILDGHVCRDTVILINVKDGQIVVRYK